jgi:hypothetical protein
VRKFTVYLLHTYKGVLHVHVHLDTEIGQMYVNSNFRWYSEVVLNLDSLKRGISVHKILRTLTVYRAVSRLTVRVCCTVTSFVLIFLSCFNLLTYKQFFTGMFEDCLLTKFHQLPMFSYIWPRKPPVK